jgi:capsular polysaccharide biosynthesis protein
VIFTEIIVATKTGGVKRQMADYKKMGAKKWGHNEFSVPPSLPPLLLPESTIYQHMAIQDFGPASSQTPLLQLILLQPKILPVNISPFPVHSVGKQARPPRSPL